MSKKRKRRAATLAEQLRAAIAESGLTIYKIAQGTGIDQPVLHRFVSADRDIRLETASKLAAFFGMRLSDPIPPVIAGGVRPK